MMMFDTHKETHKAVSICREDRALLRSNPSARQKLKHRRGHQLQTVPLSQPTDALAPKRKTCCFSFRNWCGAENAVKRQDSALVTYVNILSRG